MCVWIALPFRARLRALVVWPSGGQIGGMARPISTRPILAREIDGPCRAGPRAWEAAQARHEGLSCYAVLVRAHLVRRAVSAIAAALKHFPSKNST